MPSKIQELLIPRTPVTELSFEQIAAQQGVLAIHDFDALLGQQQASDESTEEFSALLTGWRREGSDIPAVP